MKVFWADTEKTILVREFPAEWAWEDYNATIITMRQMLKEIQHDVFLIIDCSAVKVVPFGSLSYFNEGNRDMPSHLKMRILVSRYSLISKLFSMLQLVAPDNFRDFYIVSSLEAAHKKIEQSRSPKP